MFEDLLQRAVKVAQEAEVYLVESEETPVSFEANRLKLLQTRQGRAVGLRIIKDGHIGIAASTHLEDLQALVQAALEVAQFGALAHFSLPAPATYPIVSIYDAAIEALSTAEMVDLGQALIDGVRAHNPEVLCQAGVTKHVAQVHLWNSQGCRLHYQKSAFGLGISGELIRGTDILFVGHGESSCAPLRDPQKLVVETVRQLELAKETASISSGRYPVLFTPKGVRHLVGPLVAAFNGKTVFQGASPLVGKLGQQLYDPRLTIVDDATLDHRPSSAPWDDEGVPTRRTPLIDRGIVASFLYDLQTAGQAGTTSTGHAHRAPGSQPSPGIHALVIGEGEASFEEMLSAMGEGLVVEQLIGVGQGNILGGDFSGNVVLGYKVEGGHMVGRVKNTMISGNIHEILARDIILGKESEWVGSALRTPALLCRGLAISAKSSS